MDLKDLLHLARRRWKTVISVTALGLVIAAITSFLSTPIYHSTARVFISTDVSNSAEAFYAGGFAQQRVQSYADLATSGEVLQKVIRRLELNVTPSQLAGQIKATVPTNTVLINLEAQDQDARKAQQIAQVEAEVLTQYLAEIETPTGKTNTPVKATITDKAQFDGSPVSPRTKLNLAIGFTIGLLLGCALALVRDLLDTTVKGPEDIAAATTAPTLAHVSYDSTVPKSPLLTDPASPATRFESFRLLRTNLQFLDLDSNPKSFVITSAVPGEGKTSTSTNLAIALAQAGKRVLLVDGDLRRPQVSSLLGLESAVGLTTVLVGRTDLDSSIQRHQASGVDVLTTGPIPPNPTEILQSRATRDLFRRFHDTYDAVVIDAPPLLPVADAAIMATDADGAILVVRHGKTTRAQLQQAVSRIEQVGADLRGVLVNMTPKRRGAYYGEYTYTYGNYSAQETSRRN